MGGDLISEREALSVLFTPESRMTMAAFQRMRRELPLNHLKLGRKIYYFKSQLEEDLSKHVVPKPE